MKNEKITDVIKECAIPIYFENLSQEQIVKREKPFIVYGDRELLDSEEKDEAYPVDSIAYIKLYHDATEHPADQKLEEKMKQSRLMFLKSYVGLLKKREYEEILYQIIMLPDREINKRGYW